jgi:hypothetical protein
MTRVKNRLRAFMALHDIEHKEMAKKLHTPYGTFEKWMRTKDAQPPACMILVLDLLEQSAEARRIAGVPE